MVDQINTDLSYRPPAGYDVEIPDPCCLIIFGASGDLTKRKLIPSLYRLYKNRMLPRNFFILGVSRTEMSCNQFRESMLKALRSALPKDFDETSWTEFGAKLYYSPFNYVATEPYVKSLREGLPKLENEYETRGNRIFYLATPPTLYENIIHNLDAASLCHGDMGYTRIVIEKPFGRDLDSAQELNRTVKKAFTENQVYRIDHYLAKETVQNILMFRFANSIFEPLWDRKYIDHIQITVSETLGVEQRAAYYEEYGVIRDMFQNHVSQLLALTAMEPPATFEADKVRDEKAKVFCSVKPFPLDRLDEFVMLGQYGNGKIDGHTVVGYREEPGVSEKSTTPTFAAMKVFVDNWRWNGVPFYLRSGKRLSTRKTEISIQFRPVPHMMFSETIDELIVPNTLIFRIQPEEGINLMFQTKKPGSKVRLRPVLMDFFYQKDVLLDAYEWVLLDCMHGDHMLFLREDGVEQAWSILTPAIEKLESISQTEKFPNYAAGSSGPEEADILVKKDGRTWQPL